MTQQLIIYGAGGFGRELAWLAEEVGRAGDLRVAAFADDAALGITALNGFPVIPLLEAAARWPGAAVAVGVGAPKVRERLTAAAMQAGLQPITLVHPRVERSRWVTMGDGVVVCAGCIVTTNVVIGHHVQINLDCTIGHDVVLGDFATLAPGVHVSGNVNIGARAYVGTGAVILNGTPDAPVVIGDDAVIGAGACVTKSVPPGTTVVGVPARPR